MKARDRLHRGLVGILVGIALGVAAPALLSQQPGAQSGSPIGFALWLETVVNLTKLVEIGVFVFSGYQFWAGRRERKAADIEAAEQGRIDSIYQAWQVVNSAQGKGGSGGRIEALRDLLRNRVSLAGINLDGAWLEGVQLDGATLVRSSLQRTNLSHANLAGANLEGADLREALLLTANLTAANLRGANLTGARLSAATLDGANLADVVGWSNIGSIGYASIEGVRNAPEGFANFARGQGAVDNLNPTPLENDELSHSQHFRII